MKATRLRCRRSWAYACVVLAVVCLIALHSLVRQRSLEVSFVSGEPRAILNGVLGLLDGLHPKVPPDGPLLDEDEGSDLTASLQHIDFGDDQFEGGRPHVATNGSDEEDGEDEGNNWPQDPQRYFGRGDLSHEVADMALQAVLAAVGSRGDPEEHVLSDPDAVIGDGHDVDGATKEDEDSRLDDVPMGVDLPTPAQAREYVKSMMAHAWQGYATRAWGHNEVRPMSGTPDDSLYGGVSLGATIVDSLDTLLLMGMDDEYDAARDWVAHNMTFNHPIAVSGFEVTIRILGGLLSAYGLTHDPMYAIRANDLGTRLRRSFYFGIVPRNLINLANGAVNVSQVFLAEIGSLQMEYQYLSDITEDHRYANVVLTLRDYLWERRPDDNLPRVVFQGNEFVGPASMGAMGDSYFEYLLKAWLQGGRRDQLQWAMYVDISRAALDMLWTSNASGDGYGYFDTTYPTQSMEHLACFAAGMYTLGAPHHADDAQQQHDMEVARALVDTCHTSYNSTPTGLGPELIQFDADGHIVPGFARRGFMLRPETVEAYFYLWRATRDVQYRQWGWEVVQALEASCRAPFGYASLDDVYAATPQRLDNGMPSYFLAETLKYLFLLFSEDSALSLEDYVLNTEAHPFPVIGRRHSTYHGKEYVDRPFQESAAVP